MNRLVEATSVLILSCWLAAGNAWGGSLTATFAAEPYPFLGNNHVAGDFNGDGKLDLAGTGTGANAIAVRLNVGDGSGDLGPSVQYAAGGPPQDIAAGDFNSDGKMDLAVTFNSPAISLSLLIGNGDGTFNAPVDFPSTTGADSPCIVATDINNDGKLDAVITHEIACFAAPCTISQTLSVMLGNGNGTFQPTLDIPVGTGMHRLAVGHFNRDAFKDLAICGDNTRLYILLGNGNGTFAQQPTIFLVPGGDIFSASSDVGIADFNGDGAQDIAVTLPGNGRGTAIVIGNGDGTFETPFRILDHALDFPQDLAIADYNRDGAQDIARAFGDGSDGLMDVLHGNGNGTFQPSVRYLVPPPLSSIGGGVMVSGDFNNDFKPDIAMSVVGASPGLRIVINTTDAPPFCLADIVSSDTFAPPGDGVVNGADLAFLLGDWGDASGGGSPADFVTSATIQPPPDGSVDGADLAVLLGAWGACE